MDTYKTSRVGGATITELDRPVPAQTDFGTRVSQLAFRNRFTLAEKRAIYTAANTSVDIKIFLDDLAAVSPVDGVNLASEKTITSIAALVAATVLTSARGDEILNAPVTAGEVPT